MIQHLVCSNWHLDASDAFTDCSAIATAIATRALAALLLLETITGFIHTQSGSILTRISLATGGTTTDFLALFSVLMESIIMGQQFVDGKAEHLQERTVVERRAERPQRRIMGRPIMAVQRPQNASYGSNEPVQFILQ